MDKMDKKFKLTNSEKEVMDLLWESETGLSSKEIVEKCEEKSWKDSYVHIMINSLLQKEMIYVSGFKQTTKNYARVFYPTMSKEKWLISQMPKEKEEKHKIIVQLFQEIVEGIHDKESLEEYAKILERQKSK